MSTSTLDQDIILDQEGLFDDLTAEVEPTPEEDPDYIPYALREVAVKPTNKQVKMTARAVFNIWLRNQLAQVGRRSGERNPAPIPLEGAVCQDNPDLFYPEYPEEPIEPGSQVWDYEAEEWVSYGEPDPNWDEEAAMRQFAVDHQKAYLQALTAMKECNSCPLAIQCLAAAVERKEEYGTWGGWGEGGRRRVSNQFEDMRREYQSSNTSDAIKAMYERIALDSAA